MIEYYGGNVPVFQLVLSFANGMFARFYDTGTLSMKKFIIDRKQSKPEKNVKTKINYVLIEEICLR